MKKYLMTGVAALAMCAGFTACSSDDFEPMSQEDQVALKVQQLQDQYKFNFEKYVGGKVAANQTWGFGAVTRSANKESNLWYDPAYYNLVEPAAITPGEIEVVTQWFATHGKNDGTTLNLHNYFVQQVSYGGISYDADTRFFEKYEYQQDGTYKEVWRNGTESISANGHMDLVWATMNSAQTEFDHMNDFNTSAGSIIYMQNSETQYGFGYHESYGTAQNDVYNNYLLAHVTGTASDGTVVDGYYVGFDYQCYKEESYEYTDEAGNKVSGTYYSVQLDPDGVYNDRIVKIVPAEEKELPANLRIMAEDLSASEASDFDFNDIVLDVVYGDKATLYLRAAGGTLPLRIDGKDEWEVHKLFNVYVGYEVNTDAPSVGENGNSGRGIKAVKLPLGRAINSPEEADGIKLEVQKTVTITGEDGQPQSVEKWIELTAKKGEPACKFAVDPDCDWVNERVSILGAYTKFAEWATKNASLKWW